MIPCPDGNISLAHRSRDDIGGVHSIIRAGVLVHAAQFMGWISVRNSFSLSKGQATTCAIPVSLQP